jgi:hypothetical protein
MGEGLYLIVGLARVQNVWPALFALPQASRDGTQLSARESAPQNDEPPPPTGQIEALYSIDKRQRALYGIHWRGICVVAVGLGPQTEKVCPPHRRGRCAPRIY